MSTAEERQRARDRAADATDIVPGFGRPGRPSNPQQLLRKEPMPDLVKCEHCPRTIKPGAAMEAHLRASHPHMVGEQTPPPSRPAPASNGNGLVWEDPPTTGKGGKLLDRFRPAVPALKENPGRWARVINYEGPTSASGQATALKRAFPELEIIGRRVEGGSAIFARYVEEG